MNNKNNLSFEESLDMLETLAKKLSNPETNLEEAVKSYEDGMKYYEECNNILAEAEQKIEYYTE